MNRLISIAFINLLVLTAFGAPPSWADGIPDVLSDSADANADDVRDDDSAFLETAVDSHDSACSSDSQCFSCEACVNGYCTPQKPGGAGCTQYTPCGNGFLCLPSTVTACATECVDTECATDADCGKCDYCQPWKGKCSPKYSGCKLDSDCGPQQACKPHPKDPCLLQCVAVDPQADGGAIADADISPADTSLSDAAQIDTGPDLDSGAPMDATAPPDGLAGGGDALADAFQLDAAADATAKPGASPSAEKDGCGAGPAPAHGAGWLLAAGLASVLLRRRRWR